MKRNRTIRVIHEYVPSTEKERQSILDKVGSIYIKTLLRKLEEEKKGGV